MTRQHPPGAHQSTSPATHPATSPVDATLKSIARLGIRPRLLLALPAFVLLILGTGTVFYLTAVVDLKLGSMVENGRLISQQVVRQVDTAVSAARAQRSLANTLQKDRALTNLLRSYTAFGPFVLSVAVTDPDGKVLAHSTPAFVGEKLGPYTDADEFMKLDPVARLQTVWKGGTDYTVIEPMQRGTKTVGAVRVELANTFVREALFERFRSALPLAAAALLIALALAVFLANLIVDPLRKLLRGIERVGEGDFGEQVEAVEAEDLGQLVNSFNQMSQRLAEDRTVLESRSRRLAELVDGIEDGVLMADAAGTITLANPIVCRILGRDEDTLVGNDLTATLGESHPLTEMWRETLSGRDAREKSEVRLDSDARGDRYLLLADPIPRGHEPQAAILTLRNTDGLRKLTSLLDESHRMIAWGQVALGVAHEIKNPLHAMNLHLDLAREKIIRQAGDADMTGPIRNLGVVGQQIRRLDDVVNGFLRFARMTHAEREPLNLNGILSEVTSLLATEAIAAGVEVRFTPEPGLPTIWGDRGLLYQAFLNVVQNAIQAGPHQGPIEIRIEHAARGLTVSVQDRGKGIDPMQRDRVFDLFYTTREEGSGIGLSIVQRVLALHSGQAEIESTPGHGTTITIALPTNVPLTQPVEPALAAGAPMVTRVVATLALLLFIAGCSRAPKPGAAVPADAAKATSAAGDTARATAPKKPNGSAAATAPKTTRNGATFPGTTTGSSTSAPAVVPQVTVAEQEKLEKETGAAVEQAQKALDAVDATKLDVERHRKYVIAKDFLAQAGEARTRHEYERAQGLAVKAKLLAEEIAAK